MRYFFSVGGLNISRTEMNSRPTNVSDINPDVTCSVLLTELTMEKSKVRNLEAQVVDYESILDGNNSGIEESVQESIKEGVEQTVKRYLFPERLYSIKTSPLAHQ